MATVDRIEGVLAPDEIGRRIREVRQETGLSVDEAAERSHLTRQDYQRLEEGNLSPLPGDYVLLVAAAFGVDFRYFISTDLDDEESQTRKIYRAIGEPSTADRLAIRRFMRLCAAEHELEQILDVPHPQLPAPHAVAGSFYKGHGATGAQHERARLRLRNAPINNVFDVLRQAGVRLFRFALAESEVSGLTIIHPTAGACVLVNYDEDLYRQFFSAAHEYAHVLFDRRQVEESGCIVSSKKYSREDLVEIRANTFASEFLLPRSAFDRYSLTSNPQQLMAAIKQIARDYRVNTPVVAIALKEAGRISERTLRSFQAASGTAIPRADKHDPDIPGGLTERQIRRRHEVSKQGLSGYFLELLRRAIVQHQITFARFAEILDMSVLDARRFVDDVGLGI